MSAKTHLRKTLIIALVVVVANYQMVDATSVSVDTTIPKHYKISVDDKRVKVSISCISNTNLIESNYDTDILGYNLYSVWGDWFSDGYRTKFYYCKSKEEAEFVSRETSEKLEKIGYERAL